MRRFGGTMKSAAPSAAQGRQAPSLPGFYRCPPEIHLSPLLVGPSFPPPFPGGTEVTAVPAAGLATSLF